MPRRHGRNARLYAAIGSGGSATPISFLNDWSIDSKTDKADVTAYGDSNKTYVAGLPDATGTFAGFMDSDANDLFTASQDGIARKFYMYTDITNDSGDYYFGTAFFDFGVKVPVAGGISVSGSWAAASIVARVNA